MLYADNGIQIVSQSYSVNFQWNERWVLDSYPTFPPYPAGDWSAGYQMSADGTLTGGFTTSTSDGTRLSAYCTPPSPGTNGGAMVSTSSIGQFSLQHYSFCVHGGTLDIPAPLGIAGYESGWIQTSTQGIWDFHPSSTSLNVHLDGKGQDAISLQFGTITVQLVDKSSSTTLLAINPQQDPYTFNNDYPLNVDPSHLYEFSISEASLTSGLDTATADITASLTSPIPEPSLLNFWALLGGVSLIRLTWWRRRGHHSSISGA